MIPFRTLLFLHYSYIDLYSELCETCAVIGQEHIRVQSQMAGNQELCQPPLCGLKTIFIQTDFILIECINLPFTNIFLRIHTTSSVVVCFGLYSSRRGCSAIYRNDLHLISWKSSFWRLQGQFNLARGHCQRSWQREDGKLS